MLLGVEGPLPVEVRIVAVVVEVKVVVGAVLAEATRAKGMEHKVAYLSGAGGLRDSKFTEAVNPSGGC